MERRSVFQAFNEEFERNLSGSSNYQQAFDKTEATFEQKIGAQVYSNYECFRTLRSKRKNRRK
jgi:hypothetical protein